MAVSIVILCCALVLSIVGFGNTAIVIRESGVNELECITNRNDESRACKTLDYALTEIANTETLTGDVTIIVEYSHGVNTLDIRYGFHLNITVIGAGLPNISCNNEKDFLRFTTYNNVPSAAISFDGLTFTNCYGFYNKTSFEWITGYSFVNFDIVSLRNAYIIYSSDVVFTGNEKVVVSKCTFEYNTFRYGQVYLVTKDSVNLQQNISDNVISDTIFRHNVGNNTQALIGTVSTEISSQNTHFIYSLFILNCTFQENYLSSDPKWLTEVYVFPTPFTLEIHTMNITIQRSTFDSRIQATYGELIGVLFYVAQLNILEINIASNTFKNTLFRWVANDRTNSMVGVYLSAVTVSETANMVCSFNDVFDNSAEVIWNIQWIDTSHNDQAVSVQIQGNNFTRNHAKSVINLNGDQSRDLEHMPQVTFIDNTFQGNFVTVARSDSVDFGGGVVIVHNFNMSLGDSYFTDNKGTALYINNVYLKVSGIVEFTRNAGLNGGGLSINGASGIIADKAEMIFTNNTALKGGGVYYNIPRDKQNKCESFINDNCDFVFKFTNNTATSSGDNVYFDTNDLPICVQDYLMKCSNESGSFNHYGFGSRATRFEVFGDANNTAMFHIFPGQNMMINSTAIDAFGHNTTCVATVFLQCDDQIIICKSENNQQMQLEGGPTDITLGLPAYSSSLKLLAPGNITNNTFNSPSLRFQCGYTPQQIVYLDITPCPLGFEYNDTTRVCQCAFQSNNKFLCSAQHGKACVAKGYWLGLVKDSKQDNRDVTVIARCDYLTCQQNAIQCPDDISQQDASSYVLVGSTENEQCQQNHGGITCTSCREGATFSFEGILCVDNDKCQVWQPYVLLVLVIVFQIVLAYLIQLFLTIQTTNGIGFLIGPLFYLAVANILPFSYFEEYYHLKSLILIFSSFFLLNMEVFGLIEWCFFSSFSALDNYAFHYLGPLIVAVVLISTVLIAQRCPKWQTKLYMHPSKAICLLLLQSFWSLSDVIVRMLQIESFLGVDSYRVAIQPDLEYFAGRHIIYATISILIGIIIIYPLTLLLLFAPLISKKINLHRIKPFLDEFQSSYKDVFRWFTGVYMVCWLIIIGARLETIVIQTVLALMLATFFIVQPYASKWLNITNSLLLFDLIMVHALLNEQNNSYYRYSETLYVKPVFVFLIYLLTILPLLYITISGVCIVIVRFKIHHKVRNIWVNKRRLHVPMQENDITISQVVNKNNVPSTSFPVIEQPLGKERSQRVTKQMVHMVENKESDRDGYREPLIPLLQESGHTSFYGSDN